MSYYPRRPYYPSRPRTVFVEDLAMQALAERDPAAAASIMKADRAIGIIFAFIALGIVVTVVVAIALSKKDVPVIVPPKETEKPITSSFYD
jgi:hypothetical protein